MIRNATGIILAGILFLAPMGVNAQIRPGGPPPGGQQSQRQQLERRFMQGLARMIQEQLALSSEEMAALQETMQSFREDRQTLAMEQAALRHQLRNPALRQITDDEAREILSGLVRAQEEELALYKKEQEALLNVLSPGQLVQFYRIRDEWGQRIQQMRQRRGPGGPPGGGFPETVGSGSVPEGSYGFPAPGTPWEGWILR